MNKNNPVSENITKHFDEYVNALYRYAITKVRDPDSAENLVQETFASAISSKKNFKGDSSVLTWLTGILKHKVIDYFRAMQKEKASSEDEIEDIFFENHFDKKGMWLSPPSEWSLEPSLYCEKEEFWETFEKCLNKIPVNLASTFILKELEGLEAKEICKNLNITPTNLWVKLHRVRDRLRKCLEINWFTKAQKGN